MRCEIILNAFNIPYKRKLYHYGQGAQKKNGGYDPTGGPVTLMGNKVLPVLEICDYDGPVTGNGGIYLNGPNAVNKVEKIKKSSSNSSITSLGSNSNSELGGITTKFMGESMEIIAFLVARHNLSLALASAPCVVTTWHKKFNPVKSALVRPRISQMTHLLDWSDKRDVEYARAKYDRLGFDFEEVARNTQKYLSDMSELLNEFNDNILLTDSSIHPYGFSGDDVTLLPDLRSLTCVKGLEWPPRVRRYIEMHFKSSLHMGLELYDKYAVE